MLRTIGASRLTPIHKTLVGEQIEHHAGLA